jgi:hypothetical protein
MRKLGHESNYVLGLLTDAAVVEPESSIPIIPKPVIGQYHMSAVES